MNAKESTIGALKHLRKTIENEGHVHLIRIVRKHITENPRTSETLPTLRTLLKKKYQEFKENQSQLGMRGLLQKETEKLKDQAQTQFINWSGSLTVFNREIKENSKLTTALKGLSRTAGLQWGTFLPPRNLKLQHHKLDQHFILFRRVPIFIAEVSTEWWNFMLESTLRKEMQEEEKKRLREMQSFISEFQKGLLQGMDLHTYLQQALSFKTEVATSKDVTLPLDPFSFQLFERFFTSLLNPPRESE